MYATIANSLLVNLHNLKKALIAEKKKPAVLTGKDRCEEDIVGKRNESTFSKGIKYAVFISKLLSLLG